MIGDTSIDTAIGAYSTVIALGVPRIVMWGGNYYAARLPNSTGWLVWDKENSGNFADAELAWTNSKGAVRVLRHQWNGMIRASERSQSASTRRRSRSPWPSGFTRPVRLKPRRCWTCSSDRPAS